MIEFLLIFAVMSGAYIHNMPKEECKQQEEKK
jgi:hypothetical protein